MFYEDEGMAAVAADFVDMMYFNGELLNDIITNEEFVFLVIVENFIGFTCS